MRISKISTFTLLLCLILPLNSALAASHTPALQAKQAAISTVKKEVKKPVKKAIKKPIKKKVVKKLEQKTNSVTLTPASHKTPVIPVATPTEKPTPKTYDVSIQNFSFAPSELKIKVGDKVTFTQKDSTSHTVDTDPHPAHTQLLGFDSGSLSQGQSYTHTFTKAGTFTYHCSPHPSMKGKIIVEE